MKRKNNAVALPEQILGPVAHVMTSVSRGGLELYVRELILKLHAKKVQQVIVCDQHAFMQAEFKALGIPVEFLTAGSRYSPARMWRLHAIQRAHGIKIWHSHQRDDMILVSLAFFFAKRFRHIFSLYMGFARKKDLLHRLVYRRVEKLVTTSELMNSLARERLPVTARQIACIRYGRDDTAFAASAAKIKAVRKMLGARPGQNIVISLCRLDPMKGVREFAEAARLLDYRMRGKFLFVQIGERTITGFDGEGRPVYLPESEGVYRELVAAERGAQSTAYFKLLPFQKDFVPFLLASDFFVLGSYDEMYSLSMIDAMMAGCFVIGTNNGGTTEQLQNERGYLVESKSGAAIADALIRATRNAAERKAMQKAAQAWILKEHTWKAVLPQWLALYAGR
ncbi:glycosyltransferase family 4 protein [Turneriella parva]|uniref:Glycosyl transferase group 1 n=1 Tax=Turneriella parva (strain ATCC BAA-1111 / DSM 21527 / NCTC 11395 / H) TaxID=869212 RepID=I4B686_TURPD|nr:glycosyltransferase family 4 protein [Turneriella parva]AFM12793.1 glycosyl transferase group 1 [Turneriella parva DSM 21527]